MLSTNFYNQYFKGNMDKIKNTWKGKGIKPIVTIKIISSDIPNISSSNGSTITNQVEISNIFNNYFATIAEKNKKKISFPHSTFLLFPKNQTLKFFFSNSYQ